MQERVVRQIRTLRAMRRELETGLRHLLPGHEGGNPGNRQGAAYGLPRQFPTLPRSLSALYRLVSRVPATNARQHDTEDECGDAEKTGTNEEERLPLQQGPSARQPLDHH